MNTPSVSLRHLAFVRDVLIPRAWVQGAEVDELVHLRATLDALLATAHLPPGPAQPKLPPQPDPQGA